MSYDYTWVVGVVLLVSAVPLALYAHRTANRKDHDRG